MRILLFIVVSFFLTIPVFAQEVVNVYAFGGEIPYQLIKEFEKTTNIKVNFSTVDGNETMYAKLKSVSKVPYDVITVSSYYVEKMKKHLLIEPISQNKLTNYSNIDPFFIEQQDGFQKNYSIPLVWGTTGIFINTKYIKKPIDSWQQLLDPQFKNQLVLLDDVREVFSMSLLMLNQSPNSQSPHSLQQAHANLLQLLPNIKLFATDTIKSIMIDEDAIIGMTWSGDFFKAHQENNHLKFIYPREGYVIWVDCLAITKGAQHKENAYKFIDFMLRAQSAKTIALEQGYAIANQAGKKLLPATILNNQAIYPDEKTLKGGFFQKNIDQEGLNLMAKYWQALKLSA
jgi:spermidine/putrescine transport system substrate-binding protein